jgi:NADH:ubiquinone oxidoreductase subunit H
MNWYELNLLETYLYVYNNHLATDTAWWNIIGFGHQTQLAVLGFMASILPNANIKYTSIAALVMAIKFILLIALLVFIRGGVPRYRYDFLTKIGWIKFLSLVLAVFLSSLLLVTLF